jgi:hypothetical protein
MNIALLDLRNGALEPVAIDPEPTLNPSAILPRIVQELF